MICTSVKICDFLFFSSSFFSLLACPPCWCRVGEVKKKKKKKKEDTAWTLESGESYRYSCPICVGHRYVAKNSMSVQPRCKHRIKCKERWYILYKCKNHIIMEFIIQNNIQSKQTMCHVSSWTCKQIWPSRQKDCELQLVSYLLSSKTDKKGVQ